MYLLKHMVTTQKSFVQSDLPAIRKSYKATVIKSVSIEIGLNRYAK